MAWNWVTDSYKLGLGGTACGGVNGSGLAGELRAPDVCHHREGGEVGFAWKLDIDSHGFQKESNGFQKDESLGGLHLPSWQAW